MTDPGSRPKGLQINRRQALQSAAGLSLVSIASIKLGDYASATDAGEVLWSTDVDGWFSSPTVIDGTVFLGGRNGLHAVDAETGDRLWYWRNGKGVPSSPQVVDGSIYVGSQDNHLYALDAETGEQQWQFETDDEIPSSPTISEGTVYVGSHDSRVYAVDAETGEQAWRTGTSNRNTIVASPVVQDGTVFISNGDVLRALDAESGEEQWRSDADPGMSSPTVANGTVYAGGRQVFALDAETGERLWIERPDRELTIMFRSTPTVADGTVYVGGEQSPHQMFGRLYAFDAETGEVQWQFETDEVMVPSPTVASGVVFAADNGGNVFAFDAETGDRRWTLETGSATQCSPTVVDGTLFVETGGMLHAIDAGVDGDSDGSRVQHGTLGHHEGYRPAGPLCRGDVHAHGYPDCDAD